MFKIITGFLSWVMSPITNLLTQLPALPTELLSVVASVCSYMSAGLKIFNWFCPVALILPAIVTFLSVYTVKHGYDFIMWVLAKIPFLSIE